MTQNYDALRERAKVLGFTLRKAREFKSYTYELTRPNFGEEDDCHPFNGLDDVAGFLDAREVMQKANENDEDPVEAYLAWTTKRNRAGS